MRALRLFLLTALLGAVPGRPAWAPPAYRLVVPADSAYGSVERRLLTEIFLKKTSRWPGGELARPVDLAADSPVRQRFSEDVLGRSVSAVKSYWQQLIFAGRGVPPPELDGDEEVLSYVAHHPGSIGYVSGGGSVAGVKVVSVR